MRFEFRCEVVPRRRFDLVGIRALHAVGHDNDIADFVPVRQASHVDLLNCRAAEA